MISCYTAIVVSLGIDHSPIDRSPAEEFVSPAFGTKASKPAVAIFFVQDSEYGDLIFNDPVISAIIADTQAIEGQHIFRESFESCLPFLEGVSS